MSDIAKFCDQFERSKVKRSKALPQVDVAIDDAKRRALSGEWNDSKGATFVGLHAFCHKMVYGIVPDELYVPGLFRAAARGAAKALHEFFDDDPAELAAFVRWSWEREKRKNSWAQANGVDRSRLSWKWQFSRSLLTDYKIDLSTRRR
jgi:hypothetical protein